MRQKVNQDKGDRRHHQLLRRDDPQVGPTRNSPQIPALGQVRPQDEHVDGHGGPANGGHRKESELQRRPLAGAVDVHEQCPQRRPRGNGDPQDCPKNWWHDGLLHHLVKGRQAPNRECPATAGRGGKRGPLGLGRRFARRLRRPLAGVLMGACASRCAGAAHAAPLEIFCGVVRSTGVAPEGPCHVQGRQVWLSGQAQVRWVHEGNGSRSHVLEECGRH
mmetsp:Transcript_29176/g.88285  ORF Transcript_29176/g.88285 Transcript_29176/m.88285 type:complete len:219 (-) Transcript_29176:863-1519(-)